MEETGRHALELVVDLRRLPDEFAGFAELSDDLMYLLGCRSFEQFCSTLRALMNPEKFCPFCQYTLERDLSGGVWSDWWLRDNDFPKAGAKMLLVLPRRHFTDVREMTRGDWVQIGHLVLYAMTHLERVGGALVMRFGNPRYHAGTIPHLHFNIICPTGEEEYRVALSKGPADRERNYQRLLTHRDCLGDRGGLKWLFSEEGIAAATPG